MERVGPYVLHEQLGRGGMGVVFRATDSRSQREVALKLMTSTDERARKRLVREALALSRLRHDNIVAILDAGEQQARPWIALELVRGSSLQERLDRTGPLGPEEAVRLVLAAARGIDHAHRRGVLHRDLKPSNVLLPEGGGEPRVVDFGLASFALDLDQSRLTQTGTALGTPGYWAPEQVTGRAEELGPTTDVYGLGALLYAALTGRPPLDGDSFVEIVAATVDRRPVPTGTDAALDAIVLRCLEKRPADRFPDVEALNRELWTRVLGAPAPAPTARGRARRRWRLGAAALLLLAGLVALGAAAAARAWDAAAGARAAAAEELAARAAVARAEQLHTRAEALRLALLARSTPLAALRADAWALVADPEHPAATAALARALDALTLASAPGERSPEDVLRALDEAVEGAADLPGLAGELHLAGAELLLRRSRYEEAIARAERAQVGPGRAGLAARYVRALALEQLGRSDAIAAFDEVSGRDPGGVFGLLARARLGAAERPQEALALSRQALELEPELSWARLQVTASLLFVGRHEEVVPLIESYLRAFSDDCWAHAVRASALALAGRRDEALTAIDRAAALGAPQPDLDVLSLRARLRASAGDAAGALTDLDHAIARRPTPETLLLRGMLHDRLGRAAAAQADWERADALDSRAVTNFVSAQPRRAQRRILQALGRSVDVDDPALWVPPGELTPGLVARLRERAARAPEAARAPLEEALRRAARGDAWTEVASALDLVDAAASGSAEVALERARLLVGRDAYIAAESSLARARGLGADELEVARLEAELSLRRGHLSEACRRFQTLAGRAPGDSVVQHLARAEAERLLGERSRARRTLEAALALEPDHTGALALQAELCLEAEPSDLPGVLDAVRRGVERSGATDSRLVVARMRCLAALTERDLNADGQPRDAAGARRITAALRESVTVLALSQGVGPRLALSGICLDVPRSAIGARASVLLREAAALEPGRADLALLSGRFELLLGSRRPEVALEMWRRALQAEGLLRLPASWVQEFKAAGGDLAALERSLVKDR